MSTPTGNTTQEAAQPVQETTARYGYQLSNLLLKKLTANMNEEQQDTLYTSIHLLIHWERTAPEAEKMYPAMTESDLLKDIEEAERILTSNTQPAELEAAQVGE